MKVPNVLDLKGNTVKDKDLMEFKRIAKTHACLASYVLKKEYKLEKTYFFIRYIKNSLSWTAYVFIPKENKFRFYSLRKFILLPTKSKSTIQSKEIFSHLEGDAKSRFLEKNNSSLLILNGEKVNDKKIIKKYKDLFKGPFYSLEEDY